MFSLKRLFIVFVLLLYSNYAGASNGHDHSTAKATAHAPIGVMGEHVHKTGEWMASYRYMRMEMDDHYMGSDDISDAQVLTQFMVAPTQMTMEMHMLGAMYAPNDELTFMIMLPFVRNTMDHVTRMGGQFSTEGKGLGDLKVSALYSLTEWLDENVLLNFGISAPTGSVNQRDRTPMGADQKLPYAMQTGSGTVDFLPGVTFSKEIDEFNFGAQAKTVLRTGENSENYTLGNRYGVTAWVAYNWIHWFSTSVRVEANWWEDIDGSDPELNPAVVQTANPDNYGGERVDIAFGANVIIPKGDFKDHRFAFEFGFPVHQDLNGPQLGIDYFLTAGWQKAW